MKDLILNTLKDSLTADMKAGRSDFASFIHASGIYDLCARRHALAHHHQPTIKLPKLGANVALTFEIGRSIQRIVTKHLRSILIGNWQCIRCGLKHQGAALFVCPECHAQQTFVYHEVNAKLPIGKFTVVGGIDTLVYDRKKKMGALNEIKSIGTDEFNTLSEPSLQYAYQTMAYLWLVEKLKKAGHFFDIYNIQTDVGYITYISKTQKAAPWKIFEVSITPQFRRDFEKAIKELKTFSKSGIMPKRICNTKQHLMAKDCQMVELCFMGGK